MRAPTDLLRLDQTRLTFFEVGDESLVAGPETGRLRRSAFRNRQTPPPRGSRLSASSPVPGKCARSGVSSSVVTARSCRDDPMTGRHTADAKRGGHCSRVQRLARVSLGVIGGVLVLVLAATGYELALPGVGDAPLRVTSILRTHHGVAGGVPVPFRLGAAVVAIEDEHFYSNFLVNVFDGAARAALASLHTSSDPGGSTIAQQLAKQLYGEGSGLGTTLEGIGLGAKLSVSYSQAQVLAMYLNAVYYGNGYWGDVAAARGYFATSPDRLDWAEAAMLAGLPQAPSAYDPATHFALAKRRQGEVLQQLVVNHYLTAAQAAAAYRETLPMPSG